MNWDAIGAIGQVLGSVAVFITLWYLAVQVSYARSETRRALGQSRADGIRDLYALGMDERVNRLLINAQASRGEIPPPFQRVLQRQSPFAVKVSRSAIRHRMRCTLAAHRRSTSSAVAVPYCESRGDRHAR